MASVFPRLDFVKIAATMDRTQLHLKPPEAETRFIPSQLSGDDVCF